MFLSNRWHGKLDRFITAVTLAAVVGGVAGLLTVSLQLAIDGLSLIIHDPSLGWLSAGYGHGLSLLIAVVFCGLAHVMVQSVAPETGGSGIQAIVAQLQADGALRWRRVIPVKFLGSALAIASQLVLGREGPSVHMGGCVGAMVAEKSGCQPLKEPLIAAGAAAGLAAAFNAPLAAMLFVYEELQQRFHLMEKQTAVMMAMACMIATCVARVFFGQHPVILMHHFDAPDLHSLWWFAAFGSVLGLLGSGYNRVFLEFVRRLMGLSSPMRWAFLILVVVVVNTIALHMPNLVGGGYGIMHQALRLVLPLPTLLLLLCARFGLQLLCYGTGLPGGVFVPMLSLGTLLGIVFGKCAVTLSPDGHLFIGMFAVAGMSGIFAASIQSPLTGTVLVVEMTQNYQLILPLMLTSVCAMMVASALRNLPFYTALLAVGKEV